MLHHLMVLLLLLLVPLLLWSHSALLLMHLLQQQLEVSWLLVVLAVLVAWHDCLQQLCLHAWEWIFLRLLLVLLLLLMDLQHPFAAWVWPALLAAFWLACWMLPWVEWDAAAVLSAVWGLP